METGRVNYIDEQGNLCLAESFVDSEGVVTSTSKVLEYSIIDAENTYPKQINTDT